MRLGFTKSPVAPMPESSPLAMKPSTAAPKAAPSLLSGRMSSSFRTLARICSQSSDLVKLPLTRISLISPKSLSASITAFML